jgi:hypothetical protein
MEANMAKKAKPVKPAKDLREFDIVLRFSNCDITKTIKIVSRSLTAAELIQEIKRDHDKAPEHETWIENIDNLRQIDQPKGELRKDGRVIATWESESEWDVDKMSFATVDGKPLAS